MCVSRLLGGPAEEVDDVAMLAALHHVARIAVQLDDDGQRVQPVAETLDLLRRQTEALADQVHALETHARIGAQRHRAGDARADREIRVDLARARGREADLVLAVLGGLLRDD